MKLILLKYEFGTWNIMNVWNFVSSKHDELHNAMLKEILKNVGNYGGTKKEMYVQCRAFWSLERIKNVKPQLKHPN